MAHDMSMQPAKEGVQLTESSVENSFRICTWPQRNKWQPLHKLILAVK